MHNTVERQRFQINSSRLLPFFFFGEIFCAKKNRKMFFKFIQQNYFRQMVISFLSQFK